MQVKVKMKGMLLMEHDQDYGSKGVVSSERDSNFI